MKTPILIISMVIMLTAASPGANARKKGYRLSDKGKTSQKESQHQSKIPLSVDADTVPEPEMAPGSFMVASQCESCNNGYRLDQVVFSGFDKNQSSAKESFFIINNTDRTLTGITLYIDYNTPDGRQLHKQFLKLSCSIPAGQTRKVDIPSWDTQRSFYYYKSQANKKHPGNSFDVRFDPIAYYLRF